jgi:integrase
MPISKSKRKTRSDKFPLTLHETGQFCKKIKGKIYYFGADRQEALRRSEQASDLHMGLAPTGGALLKSYGSAHRVNLHISIMKAMFHWARKNDITETIPNIDAITRSKVIHQEKFTFSSQQVKKLVLFSDVQMRAMIWLGLNCGFGCTDCGQLKWKDLDFDKRRVNLTRNKTGVSRNLPLWPETIQALNEVPRSGPLVFYTSQGHPWISTLVTSKDGGAKKYTPVNRITSKFSTLMKKLRIPAPKGSGFYSLRRTAATIAARSGDPFAVQRLLGHVDLAMATRYVQDVSEQTDRVIENSRKFVLHG